MIKSTTYAWAITLAAVGGAILLLKRSQSNPPSLITNDDMQTDPKLPRGYRNNNPLNIRKSANAWKGKINPSQDSAFEQFVSMQYGYRAALALMRTYIKKYGCDTIAKIITRWAPANENNTLGYIRSVVNIINERLGGTVTPDTIVTRDNDTLLCDMAYAMSIVENGDKEYTRALGLPDMYTIKSGWRLL